MARRSIARILAPLALLAAIVAVFLVISSSLSGESGADSASQGDVAVESNETTADTEPTKGRRKRQPRTYTVQSGDILSTVSEQTGVSVEELQALNPDVDPQALQVGQKLRLRPRANADSSP